MATAGCQHLGQIREGLIPSVDGCEDCLQTGSWWVHLRMCMTCGHAGCCDDSPNRHARSHWHGSAHSIVRSLEPHEIWTYCFEDDALTPVRVPPVERGG
jgi:uncharacterized UBP type Zn finger protein